MRRKWIIQAICLAGAGMFLSAGPVAAECTFLPPFPQITPALPSAGEIIVGEVTEAFGGGVPSDPTADFALTINHVLRGPAHPGDVQRITYLYPNWPWTTDQGTSYPSCTYLLVHKGDVIALAFDALAPDGKTRYVAVGWLSGNPDPDGHPEFVTLNNLERLALPSTDAELVVEPFADPVPLMGALSILVLTMLYLLGRYLRLRSQSPVSPRQ